MATVKAGIIKTADVLTARLVADVSDKIHLLEDDKIALTKLLSRLPKSPAQQYAVSWHTDELAPKSDTLNEALDDSETTITMSNGTYWRPGDIMKVTTTGETMIVSSVSTNDVTVVARSNGATAAAQATSGDEVLNLGPAFTQGAGLRTSASDDTIISKYVQTVEKTNYTQIFRHAVALSRSEMQSKLHGEGGKDMPYQRRKKMIEHVRDLNLALYHGEKNWDSTNNRGTMGGVIEFIDSANINTTAALTESAFNNGLRTFFRYGNQGTRVALCSRNVAGYISEWASVVQRVSPGDNKFGVAITKYTGPHGSIDIVTDHALEGTTYGKYCVVVDPTCIKLRPMQDTVLLVDRQLPDVDGKVDEYLTETSAEWGNPLFHGYFSSVAS